MEGDKLWSEEVEVREVVCISAKFNRFWAVVVSGKTDFPARKLNYLKFEISSQLPAPSSQIMIGRDVAVSSAVPSCFASPS